MNLDWHIRTASARVVPIRLHGPHLSRRGAPRPPAEEKPIGGCRKFEGNTGESLGVALRERLAEDAAAIGRPRAELVGRTRLGPRASVGRGGPLLQAKAFRRSLIRGQFATTIGSAAPNTYIMVLSGNPPKQKHEKYEKHTTDKSTLFCPFPIVFSRFPPFCFRAVGAVGRGIIRFRMRARFVNKCAPEKT